MNLHKLLLIAVILAGCSPDKTKPDTGYVEPVADADDIGQDHRGFMVGIKFDADDNLREMECGAKQFTHGWEYYVWDKDSKTYRDEYRAPIKYRPGKLSAYIPQPPPDPPGYETPTDTVERLCYKRRYWKTD